MSSYLPRPKINELTSVESNIRNNMVKEESQ